ncbi:MAG: pilus assembly protein [Proteobacteria bacterium]|nr:pilus assembly protein [Pseudomonadota bacterium]
MSLSGRLRTVARNVFVRSARGAAAVEFVLIAPILTLLLLSIFDLGMAAARLITSYEGLRGAAQYGIYNPPPDVTNVSSTWLTSQLPSGASVVGVFCGSMTTPAQCNAGNATQIPKYFQLKQPVTVTAVLLRFIAGTYNIYYATRFQ